MVRSMTSRAGIKLHLTNHSIRATTVTVLSAANIESRYIRAITGHQSEESIKSYFDTPTFEQFKRLTVKRAKWILRSGWWRWQGCYSPSENPCVVIEPAAISSYEHWKLFLPVHSRWITWIVHGFIPGATFHNCNLNFNVSFGGSSSK